ncbi:hypothetical protein KR074_008410 [Drosophila pseudoananassae]|nr:hypothetical protein KR074_008410 [Drosophila pseudoananassae]
MANPLEEHFENPIEDGQKPNNDMDKELEPQGVESNSDGDCDSDGSVYETLSRRILPPPSANIYIQNFQTLLMAPIEQFDIDKIKTIPSDTIAQVLHCTFRRLEYRLKIDRILLRSLHRKQWVVSQLEDEFLVNMEREKQTALVQPRSLIHLAKDKIMELVERAIMLQLDEQLKRYETRVAELKDLQEKNILLKIGSQKLKTTGSGGTAESNEGAAPAEGAGGSKASTDDAGYIPCKMQREIAYLKKFVISRQRYVDHQAEFLNKVREHNKLLRQPLSGVPLLAPNAPPAADPSTGQLVEIMHPGHVKAPIPLKTETEELGAQKEKLQLVVPGGGQ